MRKIFIYAAFIIIGLSVLAILIKGFSNEDDWICSGGEWIKHGNPSAPMPAEFCGKMGEAKKYASVIRVEIPELDAEIKSPFEFSGEARGNWFFEASFPVKITDKDGNILGQTVAQATSDWMTADFVPFGGKIDFVPVTESGYIVFEKDNPSGLMENSDEYKIPVKFEKTGTTVVKVYFNNSKMDPEFSCNKVFAVERIVPETQAIARSALLELLKGVVEKEKSEGFFTSINPDVKIEKLMVHNGVALVEFDEQLEFQVGGSCRVSAIRSQIEKTLKQFPSVKEVVISINGRTEDILQP